MSRSVPLLTRSGLGAGVVSIVALVLGVWWRYEELVVGGAALATAVVAALGTSRLGRSPDIVRVVDTVRVARSDDVRVTYRLSNQRRSSTPALTVIDSCDGSNQSTPIPALGAGESAEVRARLATRRRGVHRVGPASLERFDPFGFAVGRRPGATAGEVIVHPRVHSLGGPHGSMHVVESESVVRRVASDPLSGFVSMREYVPGDDPRLIHWPTTARVGSLMVREHIELRRPEFTVVIDAADRVATPDDFEEMVDVAASVAVHALRTGVDVAVRTTVREHPGTRRSVSDEQTVLDLLTPVTQVPVDDAVPVAELFAGGLDQTAIIMVTGPAGPTSSLARREAVSVVRVGAGATAAPGIALAVEDAVTFSERWQRWR